MVRVQLHLSEDEDGWLEYEAKRLGTSKSALVREALQAFRVQSDVLDPDSPEMQIVGWIKSDDLPNDLAENHDKYLMDWELERTGLA